MSSPAEIPTSTPEHGGRTMVRKLWTIQDLAEHLSVPVQTVYQWRKKGYGPTGRKVGKHIRFRSEDVERWIDGLGRAAR